MVWPAWHVSVPLTDGAFVPPLLRSLRVNYGIDEKQLWEAAGGLVELVLY